MGSLYCSIQLYLAYYKSYNYEKMGAYEDAIRSLIPIYRVSPNDYMVNMRLGYLFFLNRKYINSITHYKRASLSVPNSIEAKIGIIRNYIRMGKYDNALVVSSTILKVDFYNYYGNYYRVLALKYKGEMEGAIGVANKMLALYPTDKLFLVELGKLYFNIDKREAKAIFEKLLIVDPNSIIAKDYLDKLKI